jgi:3-oxoacyl-[acyl-carrier-protein] synthase II
VGLLSSVGVGTEATWSAVLNGKSGISRITAFDASQFACQIAGEIRDFRPEDYMEKKEIRKTGRFIQFALAASDFATSMAGLKVTPEDADGWACTSAAGSAVSR